MSNTKPKAPKPAEEPHTTEDRLDEALEETFPASDPIAVDPDEPDEGSHQRKQKKSR
ncbi:conserved hypothetical protein [Paraburkholderia piptadeniae]|uniref:Uncharacterized protein n=1 Tax=Paraburkholderia piptadeniae TaxID=1701573 RepID=A0A1N7RN15_9BURK|nr:hypothetical protein [Paraburkholderia piptadeniae]SIT36486.1 conserved hypothetical protein [Paraburkholderia piptadeniae]